MSLAAGSPGVVVLAVPAAVVARPRRAAIRCSAAPGSSCAEDRRAGHEERRAGLGARAGRRLVDPAVDLELEVVAEQRPQAAELVQRAPG